VNDKESNVPLMATIKRTKAHMHPQAQFLSASGRQGPGRLLARVPRPASGSDGGAVCRHKRLAPTSHSTGKKNPKINIVLANEEFFIVGWVSQAGDASNTDL